MERVRIAALGDSITKGVVLSEENNYSVLEHNFMDIISESRGVEVDNYGRFGSTIDFAHHVLKHHESDIAGARYTFIEYGGNDCDFYWKRIAQNPQGVHFPKTGLDEFRVSLISLIERVRALGSVPVLLSLPPISSSSYFDYFSRGMNDVDRANILCWMGGDVERISRWHESYNEVLFDVAETMGVVICDITHPFCDYSGGWENLLCVDGIHPNMLGHQLIALSIMNNGLL